jgi:hypothetical protein
MTETSAAIVLERARESATAALLHDRAEHCALKHAISGRRCDG